jgi:hypothetical protein
MNENRIFKRDAYKEVTQGMRATAGGGKEKENQKFDNEKPDKILLNPRF